MTSELITNNPSMLTKTEAIVIRCIDYSNTSQIVTLFSKDLGKIGILAKGSKTNKHVQGTLGLLNHVEVVFYQKATATLGLLKESTMKNGFLGVRRDLARLFTATYTIEFVREFLLEGEAQTELFDLLLWALQQLDQERPVNSDGVLFSFQNEALSLLGIGPEMRQCVLCQAVPGEKLAEPRFSISLSQGGLVCRRCRAKAKPLVFLPPPALYFLHQLEEHPRQAILMSLEASQQEALKSFFQEYLRYVTSKEFCLTRYLLGKPSEK